MTTEDIGCVMAWTQGGDGVVGNGVWSALLDGTLAAPVVTSTLDNPTVATPVAVSLEFIAFDATGASLS